MKEKIIKKEDFITTKWAGGETTQLIIYPEDASFSEKDFLWRVSSAIFTSTEPKVSDSSHSQRYILPLEGKLNLSHQGLYKRELDKYQVEYFDGSWSTFSENTLDCRDYNFIVKSGNQAKMQILNKGDQYTLRGSQVVTIFSMNDFVLNLHSQDEKREIDGFTLFVLQTEIEEKITIISANLPVIITEFLLPSDN